MDQHLSNVIFQGWKAQSALGTPATGPFTPWGTGTERLERNSNNIYWRPAGQRTRGGAKGGGLVHNWSYTFDTIHTAAPLLNGQISGSSLPIISIVGGWDDTADINWLMQDCIPQTVSIRCDVGNEVAAISGTISGIGGYITKNTTASVVSALDHDPLVSYDVIYTLDGTGLDIIAFEITLAYVLNPRFVMKGAARTAGRVRLWDYLKVGTVDVTGSITVMEPLPASGTQSPGMDLDCLRAMPMVFRAVDSCDATNVLNVAVTGAYVDTEGADFPSDGEAAFTYPFTAKSAVLTNS